MSWLSLLLIIKIAITLFSVAIPFLFLPRQKLERMTDLKAESTRFFRLYGMAIMALLVGYSFAIPAAENGVFPRGVVCMGIVSNAGAASVLISSGLNFKNRLPALFFGVVAVGLVASVFAPEMAVRKAW